MLSLFVLFLLLHSVYGQKLVPIFSSCSGGQRCEAMATCRFNICLPLVNPVPVYAHGNKTFTLQPSVKVNPTQPPKVKNIVVQAPVRPILAITVSCTPKCIGSAKCIQGTCRCPSAVAYSLVSGCVALAGRPMVAVPVTPLRSIPQMLPGDKCDPGVECTGGSVCSAGICICPPELIQQGVVCVSPTVMGLPSRGLPGYY